MVDHNILLRRLEVLFSLNGTVLSWFRSYLDGRIQLVGLSAADCNFSVVRRPTGFGPWTDPLTAKYGGPCSI